MKLTKHSLLESPPLPKFPLFLFPSWLRNKKNCFSWSFRISLLVTQFFCFLPSKIILFSPSFLKDIFAEYRFLWWETSCHSNYFSPINSVTCFFGCSQFFFALLFKNLSMVSWASLVLWISTCLFHDKFGKFSVIFYFYNFWFFFLSPRTLVTQMLDIFFSCGCTWISTYLYLLSVFSLLLPELPSCAVSQLPDLSSLLPILLSVDHWGFHFGYCVFNIISIYSLYLLFLFTIVLFLW